jgi:hypothetical protein
MLFLKEPEGHSIGIHIISLRTCEVDGGAFEDVLEESPEENAVLVQHLFGTFHRVSNFLGLLVSFMPANRRRRREMEMRERRRRMKLRRDMTRVRRRHLSPASTARQKMTPWSGVTTISLSNTPWSGVNTPWSGVNTISLSNNAVALFKN